MSVTCPNINSEQWKNLVAARGETMAYFLWNKYNGEVPESESKESVVKAAMRGVVTLQSQNAIDMFAKGRKNSWDLNKILTELQIPSGQKDILLSLGTNDREQLVLQLAQQYTYTVEINTSQKSGYKTGYSGSDDSAYFHYNGETYERIANYNSTGTEVENYEHVKYSGEGLQVSNYSSISKDTFEQARKSSKVDDETTPTDYYSSMTVPGGTVGTYRELDIQTPAIIPSIKSHAQFTDSEHSVGWCRVADRQIYNSIEEVIDLLKKSGQLKIDC